MFWGALGLMTQNSEHCVPVSSVDVCLYVGVWVSAPPLPSPHPRCPAHITIYRMLLLQLEDSTTDVSHAFSLLSYFFLLVFGVPFLMGHGCCRVAAAVLFINFLGGGEG